MFSIASTGMDQDGAWGTDIEMLSLAHLLQTPVFSYSQQQYGRWQPYSPHDVDRQLMVTRGLCTQETTSMLLVPQGRMNVLIGLYIDSEPVAEGEGGSLQ